MTYIAPKSIKEAGRETSYNVKTTHSERVVDVWDMSYIRV